MSRISPHLAKRIDRLARAAHRFHRFAHHPLCDEYAREVVQIGKRTRMCRGCLFVGVGGVAGLGMSAVLRASLPALVGAGAVGLGALVSSVLSRSSRRTRAPKSLSRLFPALTIAFALGGALWRGAEGAILIASSIPTLAAMLVLYRRRGPDRTPCASCGERNLPTPCRGIAPIVRRERAFRRLAGQWLHGAAAPRQ